MKESYQLGKDFGDFLGLGSSWAYSFMYGYAEIVNATTMRRGKQYKFLKQGICQSELHDVSKYHIAHMKIQWVVRSFAVNNLASRELRGEVITGKFFTNKVRSTQLTILN